MKKHLSLVMKQLAPPSLCSIEVVIGMKEDGGTSVSQELK
jgi:hypothetical protein